ncbi:LacI family DNA-binding transcriptional regulator [Luteimicrobium xylanilyticum]|uniref:HTH-type transcriptional regulator AscG n=1 Tax=Luteimicrobium xylanilyticum TaxID=1133546 RepID=A0A5P9QFC3_9MICO|nr:LacI family DNA-binding transcriptional regulator [Luteimicrobium xylanilyticum]QFU99946.1 HTH-type transcriptional regulator AscG [Luteimicrobium xylanilyticum]
MSDTVARITIADIARRAGVSTGAVSYALNNRPGVSRETRERILAVASELGWQPSSAARSLSGAKTETVGLVLARDPSTLGVESFYMQFIAGIESELEKRSYGLLLQVVPTLEVELATYRTWRAARRVDGVVCVDPRVDDPRVALLAEPDALPVVVVGDPTLANGLMNVWTDDAAAIRQSVRYLHAVGHRRIARVAGVEGFGHTLIRDGAFRDETERLGVEGVVVRTDYTPDQGAAATRSLLTAGADRPTAFIYDNDVMALAGLGVASELGVRVPDDLSIIAWDDSPLCEATYPRLSALSHDVTRYGAHVARRLFDVIDGQPKASFLDSTPVLRPRGTTAPVPAK